MARLPQANADPRPVTTPVTTARRSLQRTPPVALVVLSIVSVQLGAALAKGLFGALGPLGTVFLRVGFAALALLVLWRPRMAQLSPVVPTAAARQPAAAGQPAAAARPSRRDWLTMLAFGLTIAAMNSLFYSAIARVPLGIAVTAEFVGPLAVALLGSRDRRDVAWAVLAAAGIVLLAPIGPLTGSGAGRALVDPLGLVLALSAGVCWAAYILLNVRVGRAFRGGTGLALSMTVATLAMAPLGIASGGAHLLEPGWLLIGLLVGILSSFIPFSLELEALRRLPARVFGVLMSLEPAMAALIGWVVLGEAIHVRALMAVLLITLASAGTALRG